MWQRRLEDELEPWLVLNDSQPPELFCFLSFSLYLNFKTFLNPVFLLRVREKKKKWKQARLHRASPETGSPISER